MRVGMVVGQPATNLSLVTSAATGMVSSARRLACVGGLGIIKLLNANAQNWQ